jgi:4-hydroxybenzoate polyprenyltransferase
MEIIKLIRPRQWYKNLVVFLALLFSFHLFKLNDLAMVSLGFISLCLVSSANYIINDIIDRDKDKLNPEKKGRPIASGKIGVLEAWFYASILLAVSVLIAFFLKREFLSYIILIFLVTTTYTFWLKGEPFLDVLAIAVNFVLRAVSGAVIISVFVSPWLILIPFFVALFLAVGKRKSEIMLLGKRAFLTNKTLKSYTPEITNALLIITANSIVIAYSIYIVAVNTRLIATLPIVLYLIFRYLQLINSGSNVARKPELTFVDLRMVLALFTWAVVTVAIIYLPIFSLYL